MLGGGSKTAVSVEAICVVECLARHCAGEIFEHSVAERMRSTGWLRGATLLQTLKTVRVLWLRPVPVWLSRQPS